MHDFADPWASLRGTTAVVTGGARGIGLEIARALQLAGATPVLLDVDEPSLANAVEELGEVGKAVGVRCDVTVESDYADVQSALDEAPPLRCWVNNAAVVSHQSAFEVDVPTFDRIMSTNASALLRASQFAYHQFTHRDVKGSVVNLSSLAVDKVVPTRLSYAASKAAVVSITRYCAHEWGPHGIRVNAVAPGYINTRLTQWPDEDPRQGAKLRTAASIAASRVGEPSDIAGIVLFLASDLSSYVTGEVIHGDGGWHLL